MTAPGAAQHSMACSTVNLLQRQLHCGEVTGARIQRTRKASSACCAYFIGAEDECNCSMQVPEPPAEHTHMHHCCCCPSSRLLGQQHAEQTHIQQGNAAAAATLFGSHRLAASNTWHAHNRPTYFDIPTLRHNKRGVNRSATQYDNPVTMRAAAAAAAQQQCT
jgi:hypothetical protein